MKKKVVLLTATFLTVGALVGCSSDTGKDSTTAQTNEVQTTVPTETEASSTEASTEGEALNAMTCTYDEMVEYLTSLGFISADCTPVDMNESSDYMTDNTGGEWEDFAIADKAYDYDGLWLMWWDQENQSDLYEVYTDMAANGNTILKGGGAAVLATAGKNGAFAIAFSEDYAQQDEALDAFYEVAGE